MHQMLISTNYVSLVMLRPKKLEIRINCENCKRAGEKNNTEGYEIKLNPLKDSAIYEGESPAWRSG